MVGEAIDAISACTQVERECFSQTVGRNARLFGSDSLEIVVKKTWIILKNESYSWHATLMAIRWQVSLWEKQLE